MQVMGVFGAGIFWLAHVYRSNSNSFGTQEDTRYIHAYLIPLNFRAP